jgi:UrcA family protein
MTATLLLAGLLMAQSAAISSIQAADPSAIRPITARAPAHRQGWLTTSGPNAAGQYTVLVSIADLDPASPAGQVAMASRVRRAAVVLCDMSGEQPQVPGFYNRGQRECMSNTQSQATEQLARVRDGAGRGPAVSVIGFTSGRVAAQR